MLLSVFIKQATEALSRIYPSPEARGMVFMLCEDRLGVKNYTHIVEPAYEIPEDRLGSLLADLERLCGGEPVQYVLGHAWFCDRMFRVTPDVLIPRPETEQLVSEAVSWLKSLDHSPRVLDLCTGSGCIAWSVLHEMPDARVTAIDISSDALAVASSQFPGEKSPVFMEGDVLSDNLPLEEDGFDLLLSNPPYIMDKEKALMRSNVLDFEPHLALFVSDDDPLVFYRAVARWALRLLRPGGAGMVEINEMLGQETAAVFSEAGFCNVEVLNDFFGKARIVKFFRK